ncbi:hypothetical protein [Saccharothrix sp. Mg75]|uniref:hypothetical protein n=1 Tax=Saccharothrix sp. Mg75 TaxID=3445357 RepID=UPI003EE8DCB3
MDGTRDVVAVVVAVDSPVGRVATAIDELTTHLPSTGQQLFCPICSARSWPCPPFHDAAHLVIAAGVRLADLVPVDLHSRLWPPATTKQQPWPTEEVSNG